jgi:hypothetical protein
MLPRKSPRSIALLREAAELPRSTSAGRAISDQQLEQVLARVRGDVDLAATALHIRSPWVRELLRHG